MNFSDLFLTMAQATEIEQTSLFPFPFSLHLIFCCISVIFFVWRFIKEKLPYQLIMAVAIPFSMLIWLSDNKTLFYSIGIVEAVFLITAFVTSIVCKKKVADTPADNTDEVSVEEE